MLVPTGVILQLGEDSKCLRTDISAQKGPSSGEEETENMTTEESGQCELEVSLVSREGVVLDGMILKIFFAKATLA